MRGLQQVQQSCDKGINTAAKILKIKQKHIRRRHHVWRRAAHLAIQAKHRNAEHRVHLVGGFDHIVLLVALQPMLRPESRGNVHPRRDEGIKAVRQIRRDAGRMRDQGDTFAIEGFAKGRIGQQAINTELHRHYRASTRNLRFAWE